MAENAALDPIDMMVSLRADYEKSEKSYGGIDFSSGEVKNMLELNVVEPLRVK